MPERSAAAVNATDIPSVDSASASDVASENLKRGMLTKPDVCCAGTSIVASASAVSPCSKAEKVPESGTIRYIAVVLPSYGRAAAVQPLPLQNVPLPEREDIIGTVTSPAAAWKVP